MAEREGFEPSVEVSSHTRLAGERLQPARPSLRDSAEAKYYQPVTEYLNPKFLINSALYSIIPIAQLSPLAEGVGFEPTSHFRETVFKTAAFNHSAIPPGQVISCLTIIKVSDLRQGIPTIDFQTLAAHRNQDTTR